jgi:hypothetical protein
MASRAALDETVIAELIPDPVSSEALGWPVRPVDELVVGLVAVEVATLAIVVSLALALAVELALALALANSVVSMAVDSAGMVSPPTPPALVDASVAVGELLDDSTTPDEHTPLWQVSPLSASQL